MNRNLFDEDDPELLDIASEERLDSWKEIAAYLRRDVRTVQRWEKNEGLPIHRHKHLRGNSVFAYPKQLDDWWSVQSSRLEFNGNGNGNGHGYEKQALSKTEGRDSEAGAAESAEAGEAASLDAEQAEETGAAVSQPAGNGIAWTKSRIRTRLTIGLSALIAASVLIFVALFAYKQFNGELPAPKITPLTFHPGHEVQPDISADGRYIAYSWGEAPAAPHRIVVEEIEGTNRWIRSSGSGSDYSPVWSWDDSQIYYLRKLENGMTGIIRTAPFVGKEEVLAELRSPPQNWGRQMDCSRDGRLLLVSHSRDERLKRFALYLVSTADAGMTQLTYPPEGLVDHSPRFSPDGSKVAFVRGLEGGTGDLCFLNLDGNYQPVGEARMVEYDYGQIFNPTWSRDGKAVFLSSGYEASSRLWKIQVGGKGNALIQQVQQGLGELTISRAGSVVSVQQSSDLNIWQRKLEPSSTDTALARNVNSSRNEWAPVYSPDGKRIAFLSDRSGEVKLWICDADGRNLIELASGLSSYNNILSWSPDGKWLAFDSHVGGNSDIYLICAETRYEHELCCQGSDRCSRRLTEHPGEDMLPSWSQDNGSVLFASNRDGKFNIWKVPAEGGEAIRLTAGGAIYGKESRDGDYLIYGNWPQPGISRLNLHNGQVDLVAEDALGYPFDQDTNGLYYLIRVSQTHEGVGLNYRSWAGGVVQRIFTSDRFRYGFTVLEGMDNILFSRLDREESDLVQISGLDLR